MGSLHRYAALLMVWTLLGSGSAAGASFTIVTMPSTYKIYLLVDPRSHTPYYVGQTRRPLYDRMDEHFFEQAEALVAKKNRAIILSGLLPVVVKLDEVRDAQAAFHRELYWIHKLAAEGHVLKNREAQGWFPQRYEEAFGRRETALREAPQGRGRPEGTAAGQPRHGEAWTGEEDRALLAKHAARMSPDAIAAHADHRRSERAIVKRLARLVAGKG
jgi:hypothetical protein